MAQDDGNHVFAELHLPLGLALDRDELEDQISTAFGQAAECVGAGSGVFGSNLDFEFGDDLDSDHVTRKLGALLHQLGVEGAKVRFNQSDNWTQL